MHLEAQVPAEGWRQNWVVDCRPVGSGLTALKYLAPYIFRVALSNNRIIRVENDQVTFRYTVGDTGQTRYCTLPAEEFIRRFLQYVLAKGFVKVRYYGLFRCGNRPLLVRIRGHLLLQRRIAELQTPASEARRTDTSRVLVCPTCGQPMRVEQVLLPHNRGPPSRADQSLKPHASMWWRRLRTTSHSHACFSVPCHPPTTRPACD